MMSKELDKQLFTVFFTSFFTLCLCSCFSSDGIVVCTLVHFGNFLFFSFLLSKVHEHSSRSHCIVRVDVRGVLRGKQTSVKDTSEGKKETSHRKEEEGETTLGRLYLVDLAGSERVNKSGVSE